MARPIKTLHKGETTMPKRKTKFIQIATGSWRSGNNNLNVNLYALGEDGKVYQFYSKRGWEEKVSLPEDLKDEEAF